MNSSSTSLRWAAALFMGTLVVGSGVATAIVASGDGSLSATEVEITPSSRPTDSTTGTTSTTQPVVTTLVTSATTAVPTADNASTTGEDRYWGPECGPGEATNHGQYVSSSPKGGGARSEAAQSDCGKPTSSVGGATEVDDSDEGSEAPSSMPGSESHGTGNGNGRGHAK